MKEIRGDILGKKRASCSLKTLERSKNNTKSNKLFFFFFLSSLFTVKLLYKKSKEPQSRRTKKRIAIEIEKEPWKKNQMQEKFNLYKMS